MFKKVLIPVDISVPEDTAALLAAAKTLTQDWECELHVATVVPDFGMAIVGSYFDEKFETENRDASQKQLSQVVAQAGLSASTHVLSGTAYDKVIEVATKIDADLIVIGAHRPELRDYLLGSTAARVVRHTSQSVLVLRNV